MKNEQDIHIGHTTEFVVLLKASPLTKVPIYVLKNWRSYCHLDVGQ